MPESTIGREPSLDARRRGSAIRNPTSKRKSNIGTDIVRVSMLRDFFISKFLGVSISMSRPGRESYSF